MDMSLSKRGDYVMRSALALARAWPTGEWRKVREIVAEMGVPLTFAPQIVTVLVRAGLAESRSGRDGGYRLARAPEAITLLDVVEAAEGPLRAARCALGDGPCRWDSVCPLHETWRSAADALRDALATTSLATLAARDQALAGSSSGRPLDSHRPIPTSIALSDRIQLESDPDALAAWVAQPERVGRAVARAYREADAVRLRTRPRTPPWAPVEVSAAVHPVGVEGASAATLRVPGGARSRPLLVAAPPRRFELAWEATGADGSSSHADLTLTVLAGPDGGSELSLAGLLRPPSRGKGASPDAELADLELVSRLGRVGARAFLRSLALDGTARGGPPRRARLVERASSGRRRRSAGAPPVSEGDRSRPSGLAAGPGPVPVA